jgi:molybdate transport system regulatory protein
LNTEKSSALSREIRQALSDPEFRTAFGDNFSTAPGFVRRKFYERALDCGFDKRLGGPEMIRKARAIEMLQNNIPVPVVQMILGHAMSNLTSSLVSFSPDEIRQVTRTFMERETSRMTSARNSFFGRIEEIQRGDSWPSCA